MELMEVYHEAMAAWIIARVTSGKCEGAEFVFGLIESAIRKEATEILLTPVQELDMVRMDFGRLHCYYRQPEITRAQFAYLAIYAFRIGDNALKFLLFLPRIFHSFSRLFEDAALSSLLRALIGISRVSPHLYLSQQS